MAIAARYDLEFPGKAGSIFKHGNPNVLTLEFGTSRLAKGPGANSYLVEVAEFGDSAPRITAFEPTEIVEINRSESH